jgi:hypothetical protein
MESAWFVIRSSQDLVTRSEVDVVRMNSKIDQFQGFNYLRMLSATLTSPLTRSFWNARRMQGELVNQTL